MRQTKEHKEEGEQVGQKVGGVSSDSHKCKDGHVTDQEGTLGQESLMCAGNGCEAEVAPVGREALMDVKVSPAIFWLNLPFI